MLFQHRYATFRLPIGVIFLNEFKRANSVGREIMNKIDYSILFCREKPYKGIAGTSRPRLVSKSRKCYIQSAHDHKFFSM